MIFAFMALFLGFAFNVKAQDARTATAPERADDVRATPATDNRTPVGRDDARTNVDWDKTIKDYEQAVEQCVTLFKTMQSNEKADRKAFDESLKKAEELKAKIENAKSQLNRTQVKRFENANKKLEQVYKKG